MARLTPERRAELEALAKLSPEWAYRKDILDLLADLTDAEAEIARLRALVPAGTIEEGRR